jgi:hypothetical protein
VTAPAPDPTATAVAWADIRQVGFGTLDHAAAVAAATALLELGPGFGDPLLAEVGLAGFTAQLGPDTYIDVLAPRSPDHPVARWLRKAGGSSGWVLAVQVPSLAGVRERAAEAGVRVAVETTAMGHGIIQLHPQDAGGVLLELDEFLPRDRWFWDDLPDAVAAREHLSTRADDILAVDVAVADPAAMARTWAAIIGTGPPAIDGDRAVLAFGTRIVRFVPGAGRDGIVAVELHAINRETGAGQHGELCNTLIHFV